MVDEADRKLTGLENERIVVNERSLRLTATALRPLERAEAFYKFPEGAKNFRQYRELRAWARGRGNGWGQGGELQFYVKLGRDPNSFYAYRTPVNAGTTQAAWLPEVRVDFERLYALRAQLENSYLQNRPDSIACTGADLALIKQSVASAASALGRRMKRSTCAGSGSSARIGDPSSRRANSKTRKVIIAFGIEAGHFSRFAANQSATRLHTTARDAFDNGRAGFGIEFSCCVIIEEEERFRALNNEIIHAHRDKIDADCVM